MTLGDLKKYDCCLSGQTLVSELGPLFKREPGLPGILITSLEGGFLGVISRDRYFEALGRPYGVELYSKQPAAKFYRQIGITPLILDSSTSIQDAAKAALDRKVNETYEPIVVRDSDRSLKLVNMHTLLTAQCDILEKLYVEVQQLSVKDPLTNLRNRRGFFEEANPQIETARNNNENLSALMVDIDNFKVVNDIYGHFVGDHVLKSVADQIQKTLRQTDLLGRFGGEEFIAILPDTDLDSAVLIAERLRTKIENNQIFIDGYQISITVCIGVSNMQKSSGSLDVLLTQADQAMYAAKRAGRNQVATFQALRIQKMRKGLTFEGDPSKLNYLQKKPINEPRIIDETIEGWVRALEQRDKETKGHAQRVSDMSIELAKRLNITDKELVIIRRGALLHDIGKIAIPDNILFKPGPLSIDEWEIMKKHPIYAYELFSPITFLQEIISIPYCHHEHWDGSGYPRGLKGEEIPISARIFTIIDVWDALSTDRPYRQAWDPKHVCDYIKEESGKLFDPYIVSLFLEMLKESQYEPVQESIEAPSDSMV